MIVLNVILLVLSAVSLVYYISEANFVAASRYQTSFLRSQIIRLTEQHNILTTEKSATENPASALIFAQNQHMIEARDIVYVFENGNVAYNNKLITNNQ